MSKSKKKSRKSISGSKKFEWQECEKCGCVLNSRYFQEHDEHWGLKFPEMKTKLLNQLSIHSSETQAFFIGEKLFAPIADGTPEIFIELKHLPRTIIPLHPVVMQRLNLITADKVMLFNSSDERIVTCVWPSNSARIGNITLHPELYKTFSLNTIEWIMLEPYRAPKLYAAAIALKPSKDYVIDDMTEFNYYMRRNQDQKYFTEGSKLVTSYLRKDYEFVVVKIIEKVSHNESSIQLDSTYFDNVTINESQNFNLSRLNESMRDLTIRDKREMNSTYEFDSQYKMPADYVSNSDIDDLPKFYSLHFETEIIIIDNENETKCSEIDLTFDSIGGLENQKQKLENLLNIKFNSNVNLVNFTGIILHGLQGTGKTLLAQIAASEMKCRLFIVHPSSVFSRYGEACNYLEQVFRRAKQNSPSIIFLNKFDLMSAKQHKLLNDAELLNVKRFLITLLDDLHLSKEKVVVLAETNKIDEIDADFRRQGRFDEEITFTVPSEDERQDVCSRLFTYLTNMYELYDFILSVMLRNIHHNLTQEDICKVAQATHAFVGSDLEILCSRAKLHVINASNDQVVTLDNFKFALGKVSPSGMRGLQLKVPEVFWEDIAIKEETKQKLEQVIIWPIKRPDLFKNALDMVNRNVLLYGPPGCSKTLIAKTLATESGLNFIALKSSELISKYFGDSEHAINNLFERARLTAPSIVFFDEFDGLAMKNKYSDMEIDPASMKIRSQLAIEFDKLKPSDNVTVLAATNRPDLIDNAFKSSARLGTQIYIPLPDESIRRQIFAITFRGNPISDDVNVEELVSRTDRFSGAEIVQLYYNAALVAIREYGDELGYVEMRHFDQVRHEKPNISDALIEQNELYYKNTTTPNFLAYM
uniref:AAA+ ATPase domain-containing protein n=1 Tax=Strigamia maritima TaxID=126957 RepID=T1JD21_STRMM